MASEKLLSERIIKIFLDYITNEDVIPDELMQAFVVRTKTIIDQDYYNQVDDSFAELSDFVNNYWRVGKCEQAKNPMFVYQMGRLLSCITLLNLSLTEKEEEDSLMIEAKHNSKYAPIFRIIERNPGIKSGGIASGLGMNPSRISQIMNEFKRNNFVYERKRGRDKHYLLTGFGEKLLQKIEENYTDYIEMQEQYDYCISSCNDSYYSDEEQRNEALFSQKDIEEERIDTLVSCVFSEKNGQLLEKDKLVDLGI